MLRRGLALLACVLLSAGAHLAETAAGPRRPAGLGPLALPSQSPFPALRLTLEPRAPSPLLPGAWSARVSATWVNIWAFDPAAAPGDGRFILDHEFLRSAVRVSRRVAEGVTLEADVEVRSRFGGAMDGIIDTWHGWFGLRERGRDDVSRNRFVFDVDRPDGAAAVSLSSSDRGIYSQSLQGTVQHDLRRRRRRGPALGYAVTARIELDDGATGKESVDVGGIVYLAQAVKTSIFRANLGWSVFGDDDLAGLALTDTQAVLALGYEWRFVRRQSVVVQYLTAQGAVDGVGPFDDATHEYSIGWKGRLRSGGVLEAGFVENFIELDNSPDFGVHAAFTWALGAKKKRPARADGPAAPR